MGGGKGPDASGPFDVAQDRLRTGPSTGSGQALRVYGRAGWPEVEGASGRGTAHIFQKFVLHPLDDVTRNSVS